MPHSRAASKQPINSATGWFRSKKTIGLALHMCRVKQACQLSIGAGRRQPEKPVQAYRRIRITGWTIRCRGIAAN